MAMTGKEWGGKATPNWECAIAARPATSAKNAPVYRIKGRRSFTLRFPFVVQIGLMAIITDFASSTGTQTAEGLDVKLGQNSVLGQFEF